MVHWIRNFFRWRLVGGRGAKAADNELFGLLFIRIASALSQNHWKQNGTVLDGMKKRHDSSLRLGKRLIKVGHLRNELGVRCPHLFGHMILFLTGIYFQFIREQTDKVGECQVMFVKVPDESQPV